MFRGRLPLPFAWTSFDSVLGFLLLCSCFVALCADCPTSVPGMECSGHGACLASPGTGSSSCSCFSGTGYSGIDCGSCGPGFALNASLGANSTCAPTFAFATYADPPEDTTIFWLLDKKTIVRDGAIACGALVLLLCFLGLSYIRRTKHRRWMSKMEAKIAERQQRKSAAGSLTRKYRPVAVPLACAPPCMSGPTPRECVRKFGIFLGRGVRVVITQDCFLPFLRSRWACLVGGVRVPVSLISTC